MDESAKLDNLRAENARLIALLEAHGIAWKKPADPIRVQPPAKESEPSNLSTDEKVALFMRLFRGRTDVYPMRWKSKKTGKSGYSLVCLNEWRVAERIRELVRETCEAFEIRIAKGVVSNDHVHMLPVARRPWRQARL